MPDTPGTVAERQTGKTPGLALVCACVVGFAFSANYTNHAPLVPALTQAFGFSLALAGFLTTGIFLTHAAMQVPGGHMADRLGARRMVTIALAQVCLGNLAIAFAAGYWQLLLWKIFVGLGTGTCFVAGARYVSAAYPGSRAHLAQGYCGKWAIRIELHPRLGRQARWPPRPVVPPHLTGAIAGPGPTPFPELCRSLSRPGSPRT